MSDIQVTQIANAGAFARPANAADLDRATHLFCDMSVPGVVELFDESLMSAEYFLRPAFPALRLHYRPENVSAKDQPSNSNETLADLLGHDVYADLLRLNQLDLELFQRAKVEIRRRFSLVPNHVERLTEFKGRCEPIPEPAKVRGTGV